MSSKHITRLLIVIGSFIFLNLMCLTTSAQIQQSPHSESNIADKNILTVAVLRVSYIPYLAIDDDNKLGGIYPEYLQYLAQSLNKQLHYKLYNTIPELEKAMQQGLADISLGLTLTQDRKRYLTYSQAILEVPRTLLVSKQVAAEPLNLARNSNIKLALLPFSPEKLFISSQLPALAQFEIARFSDIAPALNYQLANAHFSDSLTNQYLASQLNSEQFTTLALDDLPGKTWRLVLAKNNDALNASLNQLINHTSPFTMSAIISRVSQWQQYKTKSQMLITQQQHGWLRNHSVLRYTTLPQRQTLTKLDDVGKPSGFPISVLKRVASRLGVELEYVPTHTVEHAMQLIDSGEIDIIPAVLKTKQRSTIMNYSQPYLTTAWSIIALNDSHLNINELRQGQYTIASHNGDYAQVIMNEHFSDSKLVVLNSMQQSLKLLERNKVDAVFTTLTTAKTWLEQDYQRRYKLLPNLYINNNMDVQFGLSRHASALPSLINQALEVIGHAELEALSRSWIELNNDQHIDFSKFIIYSLLATAVFVFLLLGFFYWNRRLRKEIALRGIIQRRALAAEQKLTSIANAIPGAVVQFRLHNNQLIFSYASQGIENFTPYKQINLFAEQPLNKTANNFLSLISTAQAQELLNAAKQALTVEKQGIDFEFVLNPPYNHWLNLVAFPIKENDDYLWSGVLLVINQRKEQELALSAEKVKAEHAAKAKSHFLAMMSHEIRTPLSGVISTTEFLAQSQLTAQQRNDVNTIASSANNLLHILNDVLDHTKMEAQQFTVEKIECDLLDIVENAIRIHSANASAKKLQLNFYFDPQVNRFVNTDPTRLQQILSNLISNAVKFTQRGKIDISIALVSTANSAQHVEFKVLDTGVGIAAQSQTKLFQPFTQAECSTNRQFGGSGLGLSICRMLVERLGGKIHFNSKIEQGSEFYFTLPIESQQRPAAAITPCYKQILILDDGSDVIQQLTRYLTHWQIAYSLEPNPTALLAKINPDKHTQGVIIYQQLTNSANLTSTYNHYTWVKLCADDSNERDADHYLATNPLFVTAIIDVLCNSYQSKTTTHLPCSNVQHIEPQSKAQAIATGRLILVAEDHPTNRQVLKRHIEYLGYYADYVEDGLQALKSLSEQEYNLLITDCHMPEVDGYELTRRLRQRGSHIPIIAFTANALNGEAERCIALGMNDYLTKPVSQSILQAKLQKYLPKLAPVNTEQNSSKCLSLSEPTQSPFNFSELQTMFGSRDNVQQLLAEFIVSSKTDLEDLYAARLADDFKQLGNIAHRLKGAAQMVLADQLAELAKELELAAKQQHSSLCISHIQALKELLTQYEKALRS